MLSAGPAGGHPTQGGTAASPCCLSSPCTSLGYQPALRRSLQGLFGIFIIYFIFLEVSLCSLYQFVNLRAPGVKSSERPYNSGLLFHHENCCHPGTASSSTGLAPVCLRSDLSPSPKKMTDSEGRTVKKRHSEQYLVWAELASHKGIMPPVSQLSKLELAKIFQHCECIC